MNDPKDNRPDWNFYIPPRVMILNVLGGVLLWGYIIKVGLWIYALLVGGG